MAPEAHKKLLAATMAALMLVGCGGADERKAKYLERGKAYLAEENWDKARVEIRNVLQIDPKTAEAYYLLGMVEEQKQDWAKAFGNYTKAIELDPELIEARTRLAQLYLMQANAFRARDERDGEAKALGQTQHEVDEILKRDAKHSGARGLQAAIVFREGKIDEARALAEAVVKDDPTLGNAAALLASIYEQQGMHGEAERLLSAAATTAAEPIPLKLSLAQLYAREKKNDAAESVLREIIAARPGELKYRVQLAQFLAATDQADRAEEVLKDAVAADPKDPDRYLTLADLLAAKKGREAAIDYLRETIGKQPDIHQLRLGLAQLHERDGNLDEAKKVYGDMVSRFRDEPPGLIARVRLARLAAAEGDTGKADALVKEVLEKNPKDNDALLLQGRLALQRGDYASAVASFRSVLRDQPDSVPVLHSLAEAQLRNGDVELAGDSLRRAAEIAPQNPEARIRYARYLVARKELVRALDHVDAVLDQDPSNPDALAARSEVLAAKGDLTAVKSELLKLKDAAPENPSASLRLARLYMAQGDQAAALAEIEEALKRDQKSVPALVLKTEVLAAANDRARLEETIGQLKTVAPENPEGWFRMGRLLRAKGNVDDALKEYERAYAMATDLGKAAMLSEIVETQVTAGQADLALARVEGILREEPEHRVAHYLLGIVQLARKDYRAAEAALAKQVQINPNSATVYSQLASAREIQGDGPGAVAAFEQGLNTLENNIGLLIGLAGVYERHGNYDEAMEQYEKVLALQADNAIAVNNLAALLADHREDDQSLSRAKELALKLENVQRPAMRDTLGWVYYRVGDYAKSVEILEGVVNAAPKVPIFQYHLGMAYAKAGNPEKARAALTAALELGEFAQAEDARKALDAL